MLGEERSDVSYRADVVEGRFGKECRVGVEGKGRIKGDAEYGERVRKRNEGVADFDMGETRVLEREKSLAGRKEDGSGFGGINRETICGEP